MSGSRPTIYDVAKKAGVSISTVSRVLNSPNKVNAETRVAVIDTISELGFIPKAEARARALKNLGRIGVITPFFTEPSFVQRLRGVASVLSSSQYELVVFSVDSITNLNSYLETIPLTRNLDGLILISLQLTAEQAERLSKHNIEVVLIEYPMYSLNCLEIDDQSGGRMAANHLLQKGYTNIAFIGTADTVEYGINPISSRLLGFMNRLSESGITLDAHSIHYASHDIEATRVLAKKVLMQPNPPAAIFAATDLQAIGVLRAAKELNLRVPQDLAVIGFDDLDLAEYFGLTTIHQPLDESGRIAAELLINRIQNPDRPAQHIRLPLTLIERETA